MEDNIWPSKYKAIESFPTIENMEDNVILENLTQSKNILVYILTFNMHAKINVEKIEEIVPINKYHIYAIGTQECERSIPASMVYPSKTKWIDLLSSHLGKNYILIKSHTLGAINITLFIHQAVVHLVKNVESASVASGIGNTLGNKGGIGISLTIGNTKLLFVCCHLASDQDKTEQRNLDYNKISQELSLGEKNKRIEEKFEHILWFGDLNYRINGSMNIIDTLLKNNLLEVLLSNDQLNIEKSKATAFADYLEAPITFKPTYKYDYDGINYSKGKRVRNPSFTDRILFKTTKEIKCLEYYSLDQIMISDHKPVYGIYEMNIDVGNSEEEKKDTFGLVTSEVCIIV